MSLDLFVGCYLSGEKSTFSRERVDAPFRPFMVRREPGCLTIRFDADESYLLRDESAEIEGFSINRPLAATRFYQTLFFVMQTANLALYMPGDCPPLIGKPEVEPHLPRSMIESLGEAVVLKTPAEIVWWIDHSE